MTIYMYIYIYNTMWPFVVLGMCVRAGQRIFLSALVWNPHEGPNGETSRNTGSGLESKFPEKTESLLTKENRESQSTIGSRRGWWA